MDPGSPVRPCGNQRRQLVNLEQGEADPSIGTLLALGDALGIALTALVEPPSGRLEKTPGDTIAFPGDVAHAYANESTEPAHFALTVHDPRPNDPR